MTREELIKELENVKEKHKNDKHFTGELNISVMCTDVLDVLSRCEERKQGKWIRKPSIIGLIDDFRCSCCNSNPPVMSINISWGWNLTNFCPNCGADMRGRKDN